MSTAPQPEPAGASSTPAPSAASALAERHLVSTAGLSDAHWQRLLDDAEALAGDAGRRPLLAGARFGMLMLASSLRTRTSFEVACHDLGAHAVSLAAGQGSWGLEVRDDVVMDGEQAEHLREAVGVLSRMVDGLGLRAFATRSHVDEDVDEPVFRAALRAASVPLLNLESAGDHPHQALADALTVRRLVGERCKVVLSWAPHVKPLPRAVPNAALTAFAREGHDVVLCHPEGLGLHPTVVARAASFARDAGGSLSVSHDRAQAFDGARVVYAKAWGPAPAGDPDADRAAVARPAWRVREADLARGDDARFLHCLPVRRGVVVDAEVLDGPRSAVLDQASARLDVQRATLCRALGVRP